MAFLESDTWRDCLGRDSIDRAISDGLGSDDVVDLVGIIESGGDKEKRAGVLLLWTLSRSKSPHLGGDTGVRWLRALGALARDRYRTWPAGEETASRQITNAWVELAPEEAAAFLVDFPEATDLVKDAQEQFIKGLKDLLPKSERSKRRLLELQEGDTPLATAARDALESRGFVRTDRLEAMGLRWRREREWDVLCWIYYCHIHHLPERSPIQPLIDLLGEPDGGSSGRFPQDYSYATEEGHLYLEADGEGRLVGWHIT